MLNKDQPLLTISAASEASGLHQQTLRTYETRGYITPFRTPGGTRMYSLNDIEKAMHINELATLGISGNGIQYALELEKQNAELGESLDAMLTENRRLKAELVLAKQKQETNQKNNSLAIIPVTPMTKLIAPPKGY